MKLKVNESKSRVEKPRHCSLLGFSIGRAGRIFVSEKSIRRLKARIRELTARNRGRRIEQVVAEVAVYLQGWRQYFRYGYSKQMFRELTAWIKRRLRCYLWKQWGRAGYRELRKRGVSRDLAWNTCKSHHGPWRLSRSPALAFALTTRYFVDLGLPLLHVNNALVRDPYAGCCGRRELVRALPIPIERNRFAEEERNRRGLAVLGESSATERGKWVDSTRQCVASILRRTDHEWRWGQFPPMLSFLAQAGVGGDREG
jgi:hypothetical protein